MPRKASRVGELKGIQLVFVSPFGFRLCESLCLMFHFELGAHALLVKSSLRFVGSDVSCQEPLRQARCWPHQRRWPG